MKIFAPDYYKNFKCIADKCRHSCCVGWEIDVDEDTYEYYKTVSGAFGEALKESISEDDTPHFVLDENERCPHLNECGLCDVIINLGEEALCQICSDHPRFRNFYSERTEIGLGLCCEAAARLVVSFEPKTALCEIENGDGQPLSEEAEFFELRDRIFAILQNRGKAVENRLDDLLKNFGIELSVPDVLPVFENLEYMEDVLRKAISGLEAAKLPVEYDSCFEQLAVYFVYRHLAGGIYDGFDERIKFAVLSVRVLMLLCATHLKKHGTLNRGIIADFARMYSAEIEYSEDNVQKILEALS